VYFTTRSKQTCTTTVSWVDCRTKQPRKVYLLVVFPLSSPFPTLSYWLSTAANNPKASFGDVQFNPSASQSFTVHLNYRQIVRLERGQCSHITSFLPGSCPRVNPFPNTWLQSIQTGARFRAGYQAKPARCVAGEKHQSSDLISMRDATELFSSLEGWRHTGTLVCFHLSRWLSSTWPISKWLRRSIERRCSDGFQHRTSLRVRGAIQHM